jgi:aryl carrier-like protein
MNDLYTKHPTKENLWLYAGRADDIIVLSNGEKLNPTAMESILVSHPDVRGALVVGQARFAPAAILEFKDVLARKLVTAEERARIIDEIWPYIMEANKSAPGHAQIARDRIIFSKAGKPFLRAAKGTIQRKASVKLYEEEIEERYQDDNNEHSETIPRIDLTGDITAVETALEGLVTNILEVKSLSSDEDFFAAGMDSLQVMKVVTQLEAALDRGYQAEITTRLIYSNTTLAALAATLKDTSGARESVPRGTILQQTLEKYTRQLPAKSAIESKKLDVGLAVVLTGSTGSLGSYLLDILASSQNITRIYCLNRRTDAEQQQAKINAARGLVSEWGERVTFLYADLSKPNLGLAVYDYDCLRKEACVIIRKLRMCYRRWRNTYWLLSHTRQPMASEL